MRLAQVRPEDRGNRRGQADPHHTFFHPEPGPPGGPLPGLAAEGLGSTITCVRAQQFG